MSKREHIINILRDVAKEGTTAGKEYLEEKADMILSYTDPIEKEEE